MMSVNQTLLIGVIQSTILVICNRFQTKHMENPLLNAQFQVVLSLTSYNTNVLRKRHAILFAQNQRKFHLQEFSLNGTVCCIQAGYLKRVSLKPFY
ncbi:hypothetical protein FKM82_026370 [Ascaphus truei]